MNPILTAACRTKQAFISAGDNLKKRPVCQISVSGQDSDALDIFLDREDCEKLLVLSLPGENAAREALLHQLEEQGRAYTLWNMKEPLRLQDVENIRLYALGEGCDGFVALGEPWLLCAGKLAALRMAQKDRTAEALMAGPVGRKRWPLVVVPTAPKAAAVSDEVWAKDKRGYWIRKADPAFVPGFCLLDPAWMPEQTREEYVEQSLCLFALCLEEALDPQREDGRPALLITAEDILKDLRALAEGSFVPAAEYYDRIFRSASWQSGYGSVLAEETARLLAISKGTALAAILPALLLEYWEKRPQSLASLDVMTATALPAPTEDGEEPAFRFLLLDELRSLFGSLGLGEKLPALTEEQIVLLADKCHKRVNPACPCPLVLGRKDLRTLLSLCALAAPESARPEEEIPSRKKALTVRLLKKKETTEVMEAGEEAPTEVLSAGEKPERKSILSRFKRKDKTGVTEDSPETPIEANEALLLPAEAEIPEE